MGESETKTMPDWLLLRGTADTNHIWWLKTNPSAGSLRLPNSDRIIFLPFWSLKYLILTAIVSSMATNQL
jgi:hypothetical protein